MSADTMQYIFNSEFKDVQVKDLIHAKKLETCDYIATEQSLHNTIQSSTVMDIEDIEPWLHEGDVLFISRFMKTCFSCAFIETLYRKKVSCIVTQQKFKGCVTEDAFALLKECGLPLIFVSDHMSWSDMIFTIQNLIIQNQTHYLAENQKFQNSIINYLSSHNTLNSLCEIVHGLTGLTIAISNRNVQVVDCSKDHDWSRALRNFSRKTLKGIREIGRSFNGDAIEGYHYQDDTADPDSRYFIIPDWLSRYTASFFIIVRYDADSLPPLIVSRIETVVSIYSLKHSIISELRRSNYYFKSVVFEDLLEMEQEDEAKKLKISLNLNTDLMDRYYLVLIKNLKNENICKNIDLLNGFIDYIKHKGFFHEEFLIFVYKDNWVLLIDDSVQSVQEMCTAIYDLLAAYFENKRFVLGISNVYHYWRLKQAYSEAEFAVSYLEKNDNDHSVLAYNDLGIIKLFSDESCRINHVYTNELYQNFLQPMLVYDETHTADLYNTILTFFANNLSYKSTSQSLFIHVNTLRARIEKAEELLQIDLNDLDSLIHLRLAVLLYQFGYFHTK